MLHSLRTRLISRLLIPAVAALLCGTAVPIPATASDSAALPAAPDAGRPAGLGSATDQFIVKFKAQAAAGSVLRTESYRNVAGDAGVNLSDIRGTAGGARVLRAERVLDAGQTAKALAALTADPAVEHAEPDTRMYPAAAPNDPLYPEQWSLWDSAGAMRLAGAWTASKGAGVVVAVVDTGITSHSDLNANVLPGYDMMSDPAYSRDGDGRDANPRDEGDWTAAGMCGDGAPASRSSWHGTQVAGIIAATTNNGKGIAGVAPEAKVLPVRALGPCGGYLSDITDGIIWAAGGSIAGLPSNPTPARVINLSLGALQPCSAALQDAVDFAYNTGAAVVAASGNQNTPAASSSPSNCQNVISVAAVARTGLLAPYSNYGSVVDVAAPGGDMTQTTADGIAVAFNTGAQAAGAEGYAVSEGTSVAAPHASGLAALLMSRLGDMATPANVEARMKATSRKYAWACITKTCGSGVVDATAALSFQTDRTISGSTPGVGGQAVVGSYLTAVVRNWTPGDVEFSYQWRRNGTAVPGAQAGSYHLQPADIGAVLSVTVTGSRFFGTSVSFTSAPTSPVADPIEVKYQAAGGAAALGLPKGPLVGNGRDQGAYRDYERGTIYWSTTTGAHVNTGAIRAVYASRGWENGFLGYPTTDEVGGLRDGGVYQSFQGGTIYWSPGTGAHVNTGAIRTAYASQGWENGFLGYPTTDEVRGLRDGGVYQSFQDGTIYWSPATGAHINAGGIRAVYASQGWENGFLGYPTTDEVRGLRDGGVYQSFQGGTIYWSPATGAQINRGAIRTAYAAQGWENGWLGYPVTGEYPYAGGTAQDFQGGRISWTAGSGAVAARR
ncbi:subtilisin family serine protease [Arthrobacter sp. PvP023]|uniref:S8 family serine peptidase n=1 Tax=Micrococcaceae TaxID=1268 RepID=UPI001AE73B96|nr:S8 family serine peptidase [Arthrobacter sp. PvP023]MBP1135132.1 subtilisin family serine protease [Arthrobacter sp. PvP023]